ncbi:MAG TPA: glycosyltransferase [Gemmatimonadaceae bacterium]|nr:glycosyltransferase [Gemmatimonadaceae bacterium]
MNDHEQRDAAAPAVAATAAAPAAAERERDAEIPSVTAVVASDRPEAQLAQCLAALLPQVRALDAELIVARATATDADRAALAERWPEVRFIAAPSGTTIPRLRGLGMAAATGDVVALTDDHVVADRNWLETLTRQASGDDADVVGGGVDNARRDRAVDWAAYFAEYGFYAPTRPEARPEEVPSLLAGANVAYKRRVVADVVAWAQQGDWETVAHDKLRARGSVFRFARTAAVYQNDSYRIGDFCVDRYRNGRDYARRRLVEESEAKRWVLLAGSPLLPFVLTWRVSRAAARSRLRAFARALPATFLFLACWSLGEAVGYAKGPLRPEDGRD